MMSAADPAKTGVDESAEETTPPKFSPGTLAFALQAEVYGQGHVEFHLGVARWVVPVPLASSATVSP